MCFELDEFKNIFFEECTEGLQMLESILLDINLSALDKETINSMFRVMHSIKGGSATFDMTGVTEITHVAETLLDEARADKLALNNIHVELLIASVDAVNEMLNIYQQGSQPDADKYKQLIHDLEIQVKGDESTASALPAASEKSEDTSSTPEENIEQKDKWNICWVPKAQFFTSGQEPTRILTELSNLGKVEVKTDFSKLPTLEELKTDQCYLTFVLELESNATKEEISEVFAWCEHDCEKIDIVLVSAKSQEPEPVVQEKEAESAKQEATDNKPKTNKPATETQQVKAQQNISSIRVNIEKIDVLLNLVGELVITQSMLKKIGEDMNLENADRLYEGLTLLEQNTREIQEGVMGIRMVPVDLVFNKIPRIVFDLTKKLGKKANLNLSGENTELDKTIIEKLSDPLTHLVRNSLDHGVETPEERIKQGKDETGNIDIKAYHQGGSIIIEISDDGKGIDQDILKNKAIEKGLIGPDQVLTSKEILELIFHPGFSTAKEISEVSGRGVGMDVVKKNITALGGRVDIQSVLGEGTTILIELPLTLAILDGQLIRVGEEVYIIPVASMIESTSIDPDKVNTLGKKTSLYLLRNENVPMLNLDEILHPHYYNQDISLNDKIIVVVEDRGTKMALLVDEMLEQQQVVIKSLEENYRKIDGVAGATILGDGKIALILDISTIYLKYQIQMETLRRKMQDEAA